MVKVFVELSGFAATATRKQLTDRVLELEDAGAAGVSFSDHIFVTQADRPRRQGVGHGADPMTSMAAVLALTERLAVQSTVINTAWIHPALVLRQFAQLAVLGGGDRVTAGLGAGWSAEEFDALGLDLLPFRARMDRFEEVLMYAHALFGEGIASVEGTYVVARDVPRSPPSVTVPGLMIGGGSDRILDLAGRFANVLELHADPRHGRLVGATMEQARLSDTHRRALTTVEDLAARMERVRAAEADAGRPVGSVVVSNQIWHVALGDAHRVEQAERELCRDWGNIPEQPLDRCPYVLLGEPAQIAETLLERQQAYGLDRISLGESDGISSAPYDPIAFCRAVTPHLA